MNVLAIIYSINGVRQVILGTETTRFSIYFTLHTRVNIEYDSSSFNNHLVIH